MTKQSMKDLITRSHGVDDQYDKIFGLLSDIKDKYNDKTNNKYNSKENGPGIFEFKFAAVKIGYQRIGIMTKLAQFALDEAKQSNYIECITIALNNNTINLSKKIGFNQQIIVDLSDWKYQNDVPFRTSAQKTNNEAVALMQMDL
eukprot:UN08744